MKIQMNGLHTTILQSCLCESLIKKKKSFFSLNARHNQRTALSKSSTCITLILLMKVVTYKISSETASSKPTILTLIVLHRYCKKKKKKELKVGEIKWRKWAKPHSEPHPLCIVKAHLHTFMNSLLTRVSTVHTHFTHTHTHMHTHTHTHTHTQCTYDHIREKTYS